MGFKPENEESTYIWYDETTGNSIVAIVKDRVLKSV